MLGVGKFVRKAPKRVALAVLRPSALWDGRAVARLARLAPRIDGARVAIVGNAQSVFRRADGDEIDRHDVIVRMNHGVVRSSAHQGSRTDILCVAAPLTMARIREGFGSPIVVYTTAHRNKIRWSILYGYPDLYFAPLKPWHALKRDLKSPPSTGLMAIELMSGFFQPREITLYGFDWMKSKSFYHDDVLIRWHDWEAEAQRIGDWLSADPEHRRIRQPA